MSGPVHPPRGVGRCTNQPPPDCLLHIGLVVLFPNGSRGVVQHYQFYFGKQQTFPVMDSRGQTHICTSADVTVVEPPPPEVEQVHVPRPRRGSPRPAVKAAPVLLT